MNNDRMAPSSLPEQLEMLECSCQRGEEFGFDAVTVRTADVRALLSAYETEIESLKHWRQWAQFVYLGGGPVVLVDDALRLGVNQTHDSETDALKAQLAALTASKEPQKSLPETPCNCGTENPTSARHGHSHLSWCITRCSHVFRDSKLCLNCGWTPYPPVSPEITRTAPHE